MTNDHLILHLIISAFFIMVVIALQRIVQKDADVHVPAKNEIKTFVLDKVLNFIGMSPTSP